MLFGIEPKKEISEPKREISTQEALGIGGVVVAIMVYMARYKIERYLVAHLDEIGFIAGLLIAAVGLLIIWQIKNHTKDLSKRAAMLFPLASSRSGIYVGHTSDGVALHVPDETRTGHS